MQNPSNQTYGAVRLKDKYNVKLYVCVTKPHAVMCGSLPPYGVSFDTFRNYVWASGPNRFSHVKCRTDIQ
jgi:hypothetical protein